MADPIKRLEDVWAALLKPASRDELETMRRSLFLDAVQDDSRMLDWVTRMELARVSSRSDTDAALAAFDLLDEAISQAVPRLRALLESIAAQKATLKGCHSTVNADEDKPLDSHL